MLLIALIANGLRVSAWFADAGLRAPKWWEIYWLERAAREREKAVRDAWDGPVAIHVTPREDLESVLQRLKAAMIRPRLERGPWIYVDTGGLQEAGRTLGSPVGTDLDARGMPAREFLGIVLRPLGLACKLHEEAVMVTSSESIDEPVDYGPNHGEVYCNHGERVPIVDKAPNP
jgi:hypothetical protein